MKTGLFTALTIILAGTLGAQIPTVERDALIALYDGTGGADWLVDTNWMGDVGTECTWFGVYCYGGHVQWLQLDANNLSGSIPPELEDFAGLEGLWLGDNQLSGSIPPELGTLSALTVLVLSVNQLSGSIPMELGGLSNLAGLFLNNNQLSGGIPPELGYLSNLTSLALNFNQLTGEVPTELATLSALQNLYLHCNHLEGGIPPQLGGLQSLTGLYLHDNRLSGEIPPELGGLASLGHLYLGSNRLIGRVPEELAQLSNLSVADLGYNALWTNDDALQAFLDVKDPDWGETQTIPPEGLMIVSVSDQTVWLEWTPILYTGDSGGYEVFFDGLSREGVSGGCTSDKFTSTFPVTGLQPGQPYEFSVATFTMPHSSNQNMVVSETGEAVMATTGNSGDTTPDITVDQDSTSSTLMAESGHDDYQWSTGETTSTIVVSPSEPTFYWVRATGPGDYDESAVVLVDLSMIFSDGFESGDFSTWTQAAP